MIARHRLLAAAAASLAAVVIVGGVHGAADAAAKPVTAKVMTRNLYIGADLLPAIIPPDEESARIAVGDIYEAVVDTNFPARARLIAEEVAGSRPHLIGLQEVALWRRGQRGAADGSATPATEVVYDFLDSLRQQLRRRGLRYRPAVVQREVDVELPADLDADGTAEFDVRLSVHDVILARRDVRVLARDRGRYEEFLTAPTALGALEVIRGWTAVDARVGPRRRGKRLRFVNTHLEAFSAYIRREQAAELAAAGGPLDVSRRVILLGDLNSDPDDETIDDLPLFPPTRNAAAYGVFVGDEESPGIGFADRGVTVPTCCFGSAITDSTPSFYTRIDHVLARGGVPRLGARLVGTDPALRTGTGLWPSDHGGVVARLRLR